MSKFTNMYNVESLSVIDALTNDDYDLREKPVNVFSCTEIIDSPKNKVLFRRHQNEITIDVSDNFHTLDGSAVHYALEMANKKSKTSRLSEVRIYIDVTTNCAYTLSDGVVIISAPWYKTDHIYVSFKFDNYEESQACIEDYKRTSVYEAKAGLKESRIKQLNINGYGMRLLGFSVEKLRACLFLKDWSAAELKSQESSAKAKGLTCNYPPIPYAEFYAPVWSNEECIQFIRERVNEHVMAQSLEDDEIPECCLDDRWYRGESFAIMKEGNQKASKVIKVDDFETRDEAIHTAEITLQQYREEKPKEAHKFSIVVRPGNDGRCNGDKVYCHARKFCHYWREKYSSEMVGALESEY